MAIPRVRCSMPPESAHGNADGSCLPTTGCVQTPVQTCVGPFRQTRPKRRPARHRPTELSSQEGQPDAGVAERRTPAFSLDRAPADASASSAVSLQSLNLREASRQAGEEIALSADFHTTSPEQDMDCHSSAPYQIYRSSVDDSAHGEECFYSPRTATSEEPVDCEPRAVSLPGSRRTPAGLRKRSFTCALDVGASRTRFCSPQSGPTPEHACVCG
ncbi:hypothetical protein CSUI_001890, partial [Cystoisospora suis]